MPIFPIHVTEDSFASAAEKKIYKTLWNPGILTVRKGFCFIR